MGQHAASTARDDHLPLGAMRALLQRSWREASGYQRLLVWAGALLFASGVFHTGVILVTHGSWTGDISWRKPIDFAFSFAITAWTLAWVMSYLPKRRLLGWLISGLFVVATLAEVFLITLQQWRGVRSHFNLTTPFDATVFGPMGILVVLISLAIVTLTIWCFISLQAPASLALAIRGGLLLLLVGLAAGYEIIAYGSAQVANQTGHEPNIFGAAGVMKLPHALGIHALQVLAVLAWLLLFTRLHERRRVQLVLLCLAGYLGVLLINTLQTYSGRGPFDLSLPLALLLIASVLAIVAAYVATGVALWRIPVESLVESPQPTPDR
jgi:hypothetical protein